MLHSNLSHNVPGLLDPAKPCLTERATRDLVTEVAGQSQATLDAKRRDLIALLTHSAGGKARAQDGLAAASVRKPTVAQSVLYFGYL
jgi:hypothetical protein